ncbi:hypothetical protein DPEC_G00160370 [Dallia pectoralis]|uniref:Uncharacterized protein n=1 Tax=Dallia pectoralis TaxID=75939 RepID=A0ACC2GFQ5_DALPE|nr:hypothetical protein DPEC_G00160370 [Dallia pectoralis]
MPYSDEEYPGQSLAQSVVLFCCQGMIEGIMVILFLWLLLQVLFTKQLEVHLQVLLLVGLVTFCLSLILGCLLCWRRTKICPLNNPVTTPVPTHSDPTAPPGFQSPEPPQTESTSARQQYGEVGGSVPDFPSTFTSPTPSSSDDEAVPTRLASNRHFFRRASSVHRELHPKSYNPLRRLSTPFDSTPLYRQMTPHRGGVRSSLPSLPRLGLLSSSCRVLERRRTITEDGERRRPVVRCPDDLNSAIPLHKLQYGSTCRASVWPTPILHFSMAFSSERGCLSVTVLSLSGVSHSLADVSVMGSLVPLGPCPLQAPLGPCPLQAPQGPCPRQTSLGPCPLQTSPYSTSSSPGTCPDRNTLVLTLEAGSLEELQRCVLRLAVCIREPPSIKDSPLGRLEVRLGAEDWKGENPILCSKELSPCSWKVKQSQTDHNAWSSRGLSCGQQVQGQLFILLQYQTLAHRLKAMILTANNLGSLTQTPGAPEHRVVVNLHHEGMVIDTKEIRHVGGASKEWHAPFLFDLPPGDVTTLPLVLEFVVMQYLVVDSESKVLGRVLIGSETPEAGRCHWRDVCKGQVKGARWHNIQSEPL